MTLRYAPWWIACYTAAIASGNFEWALWLAENPSIEICA